MKPESEFRLWVQKIWQENCDEHEAFREPKFSLRDYFARYKYWLKREFRYQKSNGKIG